MVLTDHCRPGLCCIDRTAGARSPPVELLPAVDRRRFLRLAGAATAAAALPGLRPAGARSLAPNLPIPDLPQSWALRPGCMTGLTVTGRNYNTELAKITRS